MKSTQNSVVKITYQLRTEVNGPIADEANSENPFSFLLGHQNVLPKFEQALTDVQPGDTFQFTLTAEEGYGTHNPEAIVELDANMFANEQGEIQHEVIAIGNMIPLQDNQGNRYQGVVVSNVDGSVIVDMNHPMAGKTLYFSGSVLDVRMATDEELSHGHVHDGTNHHHN
jgi:FKBP-type peptidyl-prolyl cis-trans isomerase SlyD